MNPSEIVDAFHRFYYDRGNYGGTWHNTTWMGVKLLKCPLDVWVYHEILHETQPDVVLETGTCNGGSAYFMACIMDILGKGRVTTVDAAVRPNMPKHPRITYLIGSSVSPEILAQMKEASTHGSTMAVLDSDHHHKHVLQELQDYAPLVTPGHYLIVEDSNLNGNPAQPDFGPGPMEAINDFLVGNPEFTRDETREKHYMTLNPWGYWRKARLA